ncbi:MAG: SRPBCC family protein [Flavobacteriales bacterium]
MSSDLKASSSITINASADSIWNTITNPEKIKQFLYGTETETDWKVGSSIKFSGNYNGTEYHDKGNMLENKPNELLKYDYWSSMSGTEDKPENYFIVSYILEKVDEHSTKFTWLQTNMASQQSVEHTEKGLPSMLAEIKRISEENS